MRRIVVHPGFHKTATSSVQSALTAQSELLAPHVQLVFRDDILSATQLARAYSKTRDPLTLSAFLLEFAEFLDFHVTNDPRPLLVTTEDLCGVLIGRQGVTDYSAAPALMQAVSNAFREVVGADADLRFYLSTRRHGWLDSCHWQLQRTGRMTMTAEQFEATYAPAADLPRQVQAIRKAVYPVPVHEAAVEDLNTRLGPLQPLLDLLDLPADLQAKLAPPTRRNVKGTAELREALHRINSSPVDDEEARRQRLHLLKNQWVPTPGH
ncbi:MAG: hypothetical protein GJ676_21200 [Rhodobacteraceae bacterium]|nr:hypothetical protein [Paracoccaceae bacterium]